MAQRGVRRVLSLAAAGLRRPQVATKAPTPAFYKAVGRSTQLRFFSSGADDGDFVKLHPSGNPRITNTPAAVNDDLDDLDDLDDDDAEDMVAIGPSGAEYGGPTRGGKLKEPTRFGDWERKGRCSDF